MLFLMEKIKHISIQQYESDEENMKRTQIFFSKSEKKMPLVFDRDCTESVDCLGVDGHFHNIDSSHPRTCVTLQLCHLWFLSSVFYSFLSTGLLPP